MYSHLWEIIGRSGRLGFVNKCMLLSISISIEDDLLQHIKDARSPKEAWDALVRIFSRTNDAKLQGLKNELLLISQGVI